MLSNFRTTSIDIAGEMFTTAPSPMKDRFSKWQNPGGKPPTKNPLDVKWRSKHAGAMISKDNSESHAEAQRDTVIFRWTIIILICLVIGTYILYFMTSGK